MQATALGSGFDTRQPGTPEALWAALLSRQPRWVPRQGPLLVIAPHPDDETLGCGGLIHSWVRRGHEVTVLCVTDGEASHPDWRELGAVRRRELDAAMQVLGAGAVVVHRLGLPDGRVVQFENRLRRALAALLHPRLTLLAPYESDGHCDHDAIGRVCTEAAKSLGVDVARYPIWAWHRSRPAATRGARWGRFELDPSARLAKRRACACFASQRAAHGARPSILPGHLDRYFDRSYEAFLL